VLRNRLYYALKPLLPWRFRNLLRQRLARRQRALHAATWPIDPATATPPPGWAGWPEGKSFAVVLTHDVEGPRGVAHVRKLAELEASLGFRSSYNFIPEGSYPDSPELRHWLVSERFEVGVHDLHHDGRLLSSRAEFAERAQKINHYLQQWDAVGFRAGFMLHNLDWFGDLEVRYDLSTFDTDPFEPQPDGASTLFPYRVSRTPRPGTIDRGAFAVNQTRANGSTRHALDAPAAAQPPWFHELPYTLAQDSTLFLVLRETTPSIWFQKLEWVASQGGMVLVNVHPDYTRFPDEPARADTFPVEFYRDFLEHLRRRFAGDYWQALPRDVARWQDEYVCSGSTHRALN